MHVQVRQLLGRPLPRSFGPPRRLQLVSPGASLRIAAPPVLVDTMPSNVSNLARASHVSILPFPFLMSD